MMHDLEFNVVHVDTGVDDVYVDTLPTLSVVLVLGEGAEGKLLAVADTSQTLWARYISNDSNDRGCKRMEGEQSRTAGSADGNESCDPTTRRYRNSRAPRLRG